MKLSNKHINWLDFGIFFGSCLFVCGFTYDEVVAHFKKKKTPKDWVTVFEGSQKMWEDDCWGFASKKTLDDKRYFLLILKNKFDFKDESHSKLAHEILHLATYHLKDFLDPIEENECFAYMHTYLMDQCYKILRS